MAYSNIHIPEDKNPKDYTYLERRAEILKLIIEAGHPSNVSRNQLAKRYGVHHTQIVQDIQAIAKEISKEMKELGTDADLITKAVYEKTIKDLIKGNNRDKFNAMKAIESWNNYLFNIGARQKTPERHEVVGSITSKSFSEIYKEVKREEDERKRATKTGDKGAEHTGNS